MYFTKGKEKQGCTNPRSQVAVVTELCTFIGPEFEISFMSSCFQTFAVFCMLYVFFWVIPSCYFWGLEFLDCS